MDLFIIIYVDCIVWRIVMVVLRDDELEGWILDKLARHGWWKAKHTSFDNIPKGAPDHMRGKIREAAEHLIKKGLIIQKPTGYGLEISLNFERKTEIFDIIERWKLKK